MKYFLSIAFSLLFFGSLHGQYNRQGRSVNLLGQYKAIPPKSNTGLENIFLFENLKSAKFTYQTDRNNQVNFYTYTYSLADKVPYNNNHIQIDGNGGYTLADMKDNEAIVVEDNGLLLCFWILDYVQYKPSISAITADDSNVCNYLKLFFTINYQPMFYRGVSGLNVEVNREFELNYKTLKWNKEDKEFDNEEVTNIINNPTSEYLLDSPPLTTTKFTLSGDQFAKEFGYNISSTSVEYQSKSIAGYIISQQKNQKTGVYQDKETLGGSAPVDINFQGIANEPATYFYTWYIYNRETSDSPIARYSDQDINYVFSQYGNYDVYLEIANKDVSCIDTISVEVKVSDSRLDPPNFMTPKDPNGNNKTFKVVYRSIVKYECTIFNRWGNKLFHTTDLNQQWDGKYRGQYVEPGPYFYSIIGLGADGVVYKLGGDINVL